MNEPENLRDHQISKRTQITNEPQIPKQTKFTKNPNYK